MSQKDMVGVLVAVVLVSILARLLIVNPWFGPEVNHVATDLFGGYDKG